MIRRRTMLQAGLAAPALAGFSGLARAQQIDQPRFFFGFPPGSAGDILTRRVAERVGGTAYARNAAVVENKPGAGGRIALDTLKAAPPDGSQLTMTPFACTAVYPHVYTKLSYDPNRDFMPVSMSAIIHHGLAVGPLVPASVTDVKSFLAWAKANHKAGKLRLIATTGKARNPFSPDVATFAEQGFGDLTVEEWYGFFAPARTPSAVVNAASQAIQQALSDKAMADSLGLFAMLAKGSTPDELARAQRDEFERWGPIVKRVGFTAES